MVEFAQGDPHGRREVTKRQGRMAAAAFDPTTPAESLRAWRTEHGWTQEQLGEALGVPAITVSRWELETMGIRHPTMLALALERLAQKRRRR